GHAAPRRPRRESGRPGCRRPPAQRWPRARARRVFRPLRYRRPGRGDGCLHRETPARLVGTLTASEQGGRPMEQDSNGGSDAGRDYARDLGDEPAPAIRDSAPDFLAPIDADAPVSGHNPPPEPTSSPAESPEQDWSR